MPTWSSTRCARCGAEMEQAVMGRPRRYCSPACRTADYRSRVTKVNRRSQDVTGHISYQAAAIAPTLAAAAAAREDGG